ncbi:MAG: large conductance mechanosensitive channel protein MscL [Planctomycetes bacterium]|nr:large conductance mechanosensitive channel protein MscL [Planctomycetota bacterium]
MKAFFREFRDFAVKGNVLDLAVGLIIGAAFTKIVTSATTDVILPPLGLVLGKVDFKALFIALDGKAYATLADAQLAKAATINYGLFINNVIDFVIMAFVVFIVVKAANKLKRKAPLADPTTKECGMCCTQIPLKAKRCPHCTSDVAAVS